MSVNHSAYLEFIPIQMDVCTAIIREASAPMELKNLVAKIITLTIYPFLFIAAFEALVINGSKVLLNCLITLINTSHTYFFAEENTLELVEDRSVSNASSSLTPEANNEASVEVKMPPPAQKDREKVCYIVKTLTTSNAVELGWNRRKLESYRNELKDLHPFQFLEAIFSSSSRVKEMMPTLMKREKVLWYDISKEFLKGLIESIKNPEHRKMLEPYLPSFARRMKVPVEQVRSCLFPQQNWRALVDLLMEKHSIPQKSTTN